MKKLVTVQFTIMIYADVPENMSASELDATDLGQTIREQALEHIGRNYGQIISIEETGYIVDK